MALTNAYATAEQLRVHMADENDLANVDVLERAINAASRSIDRFCGRKFYLEAATSVRVYRPTEPDIAWVDDIGSATGLVIKTDTTGDGTWATTWTSGDFQLEPLNADIVGAGTTIAPYAWWRIVTIGTKRFPVSHARPSLQVTARFGWSGVPDDVNEASLLKAAGLFKRKDSPQGVMGFDGFGAVRVTRQDPDVIALLRPYMRLQIGAV